MAGSRQGRLRLGGAETVFDPDPTAASFSFATGEAGAGNGQFDIPAGVAVDHDTGDVWIADFNNDRVQHFNAAGEYLGQFGETGSGDGQLDGPEGIGFDALGLLWVVDSNNDRVQQFSRTGKYLRQFGEEGSGFGKLCVITQTSPHPITEIPQV